MSKRIRDLMNKSKIDIRHIEKHADEDFSEQFKEYTKMVIRECAKELRDAEIEADRAYKAGEIKERNHFNGNDFADMLEERFVL